MHWSRILPVLLFIPASVAAQTDDQDWVRRCQERDDDDRARVCDVRVQRVAAASALDVDAGTNGGISIVGWDRAEVELHTRIQAHARSEERARELASNVRVEAGSGSIRADVPETGRRESASVSFVLYVPQRTGLALRTHNGPISLRSVNGAIRAEAHNGPITLHEVGGDVHARTRNGPLNIHLDGRAWAGKGLDAETRNGPVNLYVPEGYSAELETGTVNGPMSSDVPLTMTVQGRVDRRIRATLGSGGPAIRVLTTNGPVSIRRP